MTLSQKQTELLNQMDICWRDNKENEEDYMKKVKSLKIPAIFFPNNRHITLNYEDYLSSCKLKRAKTLKEVYNLDPFTIAMEEITNNEILLYRHQLENILQAGLHALMEIQFLDTMVLLRNNDCEEKLLFDFDLKNISFLMKNLVRFFNMNPKTVANELYEEETTRALKQINIQSYKPPEFIHDIKTNIELKSMACAFASQHKCKIDVNVENKGNL